MEAGAAGAARTEGAAGEARTAAGDVNSGFLQKQEQQLGGLFQQEDLLEEHLISTSQELQHVTGGASAGMPSSGPFMTPDQINGSHYTFYNWQLSGERNTNSAISREKSPCNSPANSGVAEGCRWPDDNAYESSFSLRLSESDIKFPKIDTSRNGYKLSQDHSPVFLAEGRRVCRGIKPCVLFVSSVYLLVSI